MCASSRIGINRQEYSWKNTETKKPALEAEKARHQTKLAYNASQTSMHRLYDPECNEALNGEREEKVR